MTLLLDSGLGLREWAKQNGASAYTTYDACLIKLANDNELRQTVLGRIDHSAARIFCETGDVHFDHYVSTVLAMQTICLGISNKYVLEQLSIELLDAFANLHESHCATRKWLRNLMAKKYRTSSGIYRFGHLTKTALLAASLLGYHDKDPIFIWALENRSGIEEANQQQWARFANDTLLEDGYPPFDVWIVHHNKQSIVRRVDIDTNSLFCRRLLRDSTLAMNNWNDLQRVNCPFFNEFITSIGFTPKRLEDFTDETLMRQIIWFRDKQGFNESTYRFLRHFYKYLLRMMARK